MLRPIPPSSLRALFPLLLWGAVPLSTHAQAGTELLNLTSGTQHELLVEKGVSRIAIADEGVVGVTLTRQTKGSPAARLVITAKAPGSTSLLVWEPGSTRARTYTVQVQRRLAVFDGDFPDTQARRLALATALASHPEKTEAIDRSTVQLKSHTVQVDVKIVEFNKNVLKRAGINFFSAASNRHGFTFGVSTPGTTPTYGVGVSNTLTQSQNSTSSLGANGSVTVVPGAQATGSLTLAGALSSAAAAGSAGTTALNYGLTSPVVDAFNLLGYSTKAGIGMALGLLEGNNLARVLAEPTLVALSGQSANFLAGGEIPIPIAQGLGTVSVEYKPFGIGLTVSPTVLANNRIALKVAPEASELNYSNAVALNGTVVPAIATRRADTTVELSDGESFVIGGLVSRQTWSNIDKVPMLGDIPVLGALFKSMEFQRNESELVIIVTPHLVQPMARGAVREDALPGANEQRGDAPVWRSYLSGAASDDALPGFSR
ncbi:type II and III secretion system protein family protein [Hydrogenophaga sp. NFH-34]|uniref:type II and III secretion system protein family protein n=1 Tax=Hydrogenophaga sp. NFH-34 TaxID=2744446 RepID=UPI002DD44D71|nr:pilus assembly protein N-terminal domain-containing protein [Hydrogenophaga sp. NFH-34]